MPDETEGEIVVTARRRNEGSDMQPHVSLRIDTGGAQSNLEALFDALPSGLRALFVEGTDFDIDENFSPKQKEVIRKAIAGLAKHPRFAAAFAELLKKAADINIRPGTRSDQLTDNDDAGISGLNESDSSVPQGAKIDIYIRLIKYDYTRSPRQIAESIVHELIHALGIPEFNSLLHAPDSTFARDVARDIFRGYDYNAPAEEGTGVTGLIRGPDAGGDLAGTAGPDILAGSPHADTATPGEGENIVYPGQGDDRILVEVNGKLDLVREDGGNDRLVFPPGVSPASITTRWSDDRIDLMVLVNGVPEVLIENANGSGAIETVEVAGSSFPIGSFANSINAAPVEVEKHFDVFGAFYGGYVGSAAIADADPLTYALGSVTGDYADLAWTVDPNTGAIQANFSKEDRQGSQFTLLTVSATDKLAMSEVRVTIRWAYSNEETPQL